MKNILQLLKRSLATIVVALSFACVHQPEVAKVETPTTQKKNLVLITGSHLDETSWNLVIQNLPADKYNILAMPRLGRDADHPEHLKQTAEMACAKITAPTTIVAHSFGGAVTNEIIGVCPAKVKKIIYVSALVPMNGEHPTDMLKGANQKAYMSAVKVGKDRITPKKQIVFFKKLDASLKLDQKNLPPVYAESMLSLGDVIENSAADFNKIAIYYIYTSDDKVIPLDYQKRMTARLTLAGSDSVKSGHLPLLTKPAELAQILQKFIDEKTDL